MPTAAYFRQKAEQCNRLASGLDRNEPAREAIFKLAIEFTIQAAALEVEASAASAIGLDQSVTDHAPGRNERS